jgi:hypothetical protein
MKREGMDDGEVVEVEVRWNLPVTSESEHLKVDRLIENNKKCGSSGIDRQYDAGPCIDRQESLAIPL